MSLKNTFRLFFSNFSLVWKSGFYKLLVVSLITALSIRYLSPIVKVIGASELLQEVMTFFTQGVIKFDGNVMSSFYKIAENFINILNNENLMSNLVILVVLITIVLPFFLNLSKLTECEVLYGSMSSNSNVSWINCFVKNIWRSIRLSAFLLFFNVPSAIICLVLFYCCVKIFILGGIWSTVAIIICIVSLVLIFCIFALLTADIDCVMVIHDYGVFKAFAKSKDALIKRVGYTFYSLIVLTTLSLAINVFIGSFTYFAGLVITLPMSAILFKVFDMVNYYYAQGMNFYVNPVTIERTTKLEDQINIREMENLI